MSRLLPPFGFVLSLVVFGSAASLPLWGVLVALVTFLVLALPGVLLIRYVFPEEKSALLILVLGAVLGLALGRFGLALFGLLIGPGPLSTGLLLACAILAAAALLLRLKRNALVAWDETDTGEGAWLLGTLAVLYLALALPYWGVGRITPQGNAFVPYFDRDYLNHVSMTAELTRALPPQNPFFAGERLHYYWSYHLWPAAIETISGVSARDALNLTILPTVGLFVAALSLWVRLYLPSRAVRYSAIGLGLFAYSYIGLLYLIKVFLPSMARFVPQLAQSDYSFLSHSWFRDFLYEPHAVTSLTLFLTMLLLNHLLPASRRRLAGCLIGLGFGAMLVTDAFIGAVGLLYFTATNVLAFLRDAQRREPLLFAAGLTTLVVAAAITVGIFPLGSRALQLAVHPAAKYAPFYLLVELGPLFACGTIGVVLLVFRGESRAFGTLLILLSLALLLGFILRVPVEPNIALRKAVKVAQLPLVIFAGCAILAIATSSRRIRWGAAGAIIVLPGLVTLGTDILRYVDLTGIRTPPTTYVSRDELEMLNWVRNNTPADAVLQTVNPERFFGNSTDLLIPALAERRTYYGNAEMPKMFQVPLPLIEQRLDKIRALFTATHSSQMLDVLGNSTPIYLYVDEAAVGPTAALQQLEAQGVLHQIHQSGRFSLKKVLQQSNADFRNRRNPLSG